jgi:hypothetical protein
MTERQLLLKAKYALIKIHTILELAQGHTNHNGLELTEPEWSAIYDAIQSGLDGEDV